MQEIDQATLKDWPDVDAFVGRLNAPETSPRLLGRWDPSAAAIVTRAPGRLDVMGGIADYSGSLVLELPLGEATCVALQPNETRQITIVSSSLDREEGAAVFEMPLEDLFQGGVPVGYRQAREMFQRDRSRTWAAYVAGAFLVLMRETGAVFPHGACLVIDSRVPEGKGVASSAALTVAAMTAIAAAYAIELEGRELALLSQKVENFVVGAPCGVMDPMTSVFGESNQLMALLCQPAERKANIAVPGELVFWGMDSGIAHAVSGADYGSVRAGAFMGFRLLQELSGHDWGGYLANLTPSELEAKYLARLPKKMSGEAFLDRFEGTTDTATKVEPSRTYFLRASTVHPVYEHFRVRAFARLLASHASGNAPLLGELMYQSHASYSACGLGSPGTDRLVEMARAAGISRGIFGAKITGGGSGGTVAILGRRDAEGAIHDIARQYHEATGASPQIFQGSSPGVLQFGARRFRP